MLESKFHLLCFGAARLSPFDFDIGFHFLDLGEVVSLAQQELIPLTEKRVSVGVRAQPRTVHIAVDEVHAHAHVVVNQNVVFLVQLHSRELVPTRAALHVVQPVLEQLGTDRNLGQIVVQLEARLEAILLVLLKPLVAF